MNVNNFNTSMSFCFRLAYATLACFFSLGSFAQTKEVKNVILMIPDGTSASVITLSRWYKANLQGASPQKNSVLSSDKGIYPPYFGFEQFLCGMVSTHSSGGLIAESAPAATAMATGKKSQPGFIGLSADTIPFATNMELAKILKNKATGLVFTSEFTHATPAAFTSHCINRNDYKTIKQQMINSSLNVVFGGGGNSVLNSGDELYLKNRGYKVTHHFEETKTYSGNTIWGLFNSDSAYDGYMAFDLDRQTLQLNEPSLSEMTEQAIRILEKNDNGFFLMVEGSKVDWAAHANDPVGVVTEFLAFEKAVNVALDYARKNKNTVVIICADHATGGLSIGNHYSDKGTNFNNDSSYIQYNKLPYQKIVKNLQNYNLTGDGIERQIEIQQSWKNKDSLQQIIGKARSGFFKTNNDTSLNQALNYFNVKKKGDRVLSSGIGINQFTSNQTYVGWTTHGHTGEDVPLYIYHPNAYVLNGLVDNTAIATYINDVLGMPESNKNGVVYHAVKVTQDYEWKDGKLNFTYGKNKFSFLINTNLYYYNGVLTQSPLLNLYINNTLYTTLDVLK